MAESTGDFTLNISDFGTTTNPDGTPATGPLFGTDQGAAAEDAEPDLWESSKLGDNMYLKPFFESAEKALDLHRANAKFIKDFYEFVPDPINKQNEYKAVKKESILKDIKKVISEADKIQKIMKKKMHRR